MDKAGQRKEMTNLLRNMDAAEHRIKSDRIIDFLLKEKAFRNVRIIVDVDPV